MDVCIFISQIKGRWNYENALKSSWKLEFSWLLQRKSDIGILLLYIIYNIYNI